MHLFLLLTVGDRCKAGAILGVGLLREGEVDVCLHRRVFRRGTLPGKRSCSSIAREKFLLGHPIALLNDRLVPRGLERGQFTNRRMRLDVSESFCILLHKLVHRDA